MRNLLTYILIFTICFGCSDKNSEWKSKMDATIFFGAEPKNEKFNLTFKKTGNKLNFKYVNQIDTTKTIAINKIIDTDTLLFGFDKFVKTSKKPFTNDELQGLEFDYYDTLDYADDATGPILFSEKYGLLAINNVYGPTIIFLDKKNDYLNEYIIDKLNE
ncbi:hypothetical protein [Tenacibaculum sp. SZ-18]|uniref:hypothetical protein n=1 Tax=Tenacibaculum sp. SZ-18 TaxID=754423 RepID=UPI0012FDEEFE|nr:hypothetical protein [Tenacibaculum sp. SZ-18]